MSLSIDPSAGVVLVVFTMKGCPACSEFKPRLERMLRKHPPGFPVYILDESEHPGEANRLGAKAMPSMHLLRRPEGAITVTGSVPDSQIEWLLGVGEREQRRWRGY